MSFKNQTKSRTLRPSRITQELHRDHLKTNLEWPEEDNKKTKQDVDEEEEEQQQEQEKETNRSRRRRRRKQKKTTNRGEGTKRTTK